MCHDVLTDIETYQRQRYMALMSYDEMNLTKWKRKSEKRNAITLEKVKS